MVDFASFIHSNTDGELVLSLTVIIDKTFQKSEEVCPSEFYFRILQIFSRRQLCIGYKNIYPCFTPRRKLNTLPASTFVCQ
jgi:hypothetical protein